MIRWMRASHCAMATCAIMFFSGCATVAKTEFVDADGASFAAVSSA